MSRTILITGCSSGIGRMTAKLFQEKGWNVSATVRANPDGDTELNELDNVLVSPHSAGVTQQSSVRMGTELMRNVLDALDGRPNPEAFANPSILEE